MRQIERISRDRILAHLPLFEGVAPPVEGATRAPVIEGGGA